MTATITNLEQYKMIKNPVKVETKQALLPCEHCRRATWHDYKQANLGETVAYKTNQGESVNARVFYLIFGCKACKNLRLWGTQVRKY